MYIAVRSIREPTTPICSNIVVYNNRKCLAISYGKIIKFYELNGRKLVMTDSLFPGAYVCEIIPLKNDFLLLVSKDLQFVLMKDMRTIKKGRVIQEFVKVHTQLLKKCVYNDEFVIFIFENSKMSIFNLVENHLRINENIKELLAYKILDAVINKNELTCLVQDSEDRTHIHRYFIREGNREIVYKDRKMFKDAKRIFFAFGFLYVLRKNYISIMDKDDKIEEIFFANSGILSGTPWNGGILMSSKDGEIIHLKKEKIDILMTIDYRFKSLLPFDNFIFANSCMGYSALISLNGKKIIYDQIPNISYIRCPKVHNGIKFLSGCVENDNICTLKYTIPVKKEKILDCLTYVKKFWVFNEMIYASFVGFSILFKSGMFYGKMDEILDFKAFDRYCIIITANSIFRITDTSKKADFPGIILSDIQKNEILIYTEEKRLFLIKTQDFEIIKKVIVADEVSLIKRIGQTCLISTFTCKLKFLDKQLKSIRTEECPIISYCEQLDDKRLIVVFTSGLTCCLTLESQRTENLFALKGIKGLVKRGEDIFIFGKKIIKITPNLECFNLDIKDVQHLTTDDKNIFICKKSFISTVHIEDLPKLTIQKRPLPDFGLSFCSSKTQKALAYRNEDGSRIVLKTKSTNAKFLTRYFREIYQSKNKTNVIKKQKIHKSSDSEDMDKEAKPTFQIEINKYEIDILKNTVKCIRFYKRYLIIGANISNCSEMGLSRLILYDGLELLSEVCKTGHIVDFQVYKDYILTSHGAVLTVYKIENSKLIEIAQKSMTILIWRIHINKFRFIVANMWRSFVAMEFDPKTRVIDEKNRFYDNIVIDAGAFFKKCFILAEKTLSLSMYTTRSNDYEIARVSSINLNEEITSITKGSLNARTDKRMHYATSANGAIFAIKKYKKNPIIEAISRVIRRVGAKMLFNHRDSLRAYDKLSCKGVTYFIDCDILKYHPDIEKCVEKTCKNKKEVLELIRELISIH